MRDLLQSVAMKVTDGLAAVIPQPVPEQRALRSCKIISHRGEHDNVLVFENTLAAFEQARANGVWGVECDIRWTADLVRGERGVDVAQKVARRVEELVLISGNLG